jgi:hypothetical protein
MRVSSSWLWLLVLVQVAVPASYYFRDDPDDERFAWRMFSAVRLKRCTIEAYESEDARGESLKRTDLARAVHASWQRSLERGRRPVIERFLAARCGRPPASSSSEASPGGDATPTPSVSFARLSRRCVAPSGEVLPPELFRYDCASGAFEQTR